MAAAPVMPILAVMPALAVLAVPMPTTMMLGVCRGAVEVVVACVPVFIVFEIGRASCRDRVF